MFNFFKKKIPFDFSLLQVDMHAHWLPGIDDGAQNMEDSITLIRGLKELGYRKLIATPHVMSDLYPNTPDNIKSSLAEVKEAVAKQHLDIELETAAEYLIDEGFEEKIKQEELLTLPGNRVLVEFSFISEPPNYQEIFFTLQTKGYRPVLAHPERYQYWHHELNKIMEIAEKGIELQINLLSLIGHYGKPIQKVAEELINANFITFLGTDIHSQNHLQKFQHFMLRKKTNDALVSRHWNNHALA